MNRFVNSAKIDIRCKKNKTGGINHEKDNSNR